MKWCERCGRYFNINTGRYINTAGTAMGALVDGESSVCGSCLRINEHWHGGVLIDEPAQTCELCNAA